MSRKSILPYALTALLTVAAGCSKDKSSSTEPSGSTLTDVEFNDMMDALSALGSFAFVPGGRPATSAGLAAQQNFSLPIDESVPCPLGGTTRTQGNLTYSINGQSLTYSGSLTETYSNCKASGNGTTFTFNGNPSLTMSLNFTENASTGTVSGTMHETGGINWAGNSKTGGCSVDINISYSVSAAGLETGSYTGTVCGRSVNQSL